MTSIIYTATDMSNVLSEVLWDRRYLMNCVAMNLVPLRGEGSESVP